MRIGRFVDRGVCMISKNIPVHVSGKETVYMMCIQLYENYEE